MSDIIDISIGLTEEVVEINSTPNVVEVNIITGTTINPLSYDLIDFTNISPNPFVQYSALAGFVPTSRLITINGITQDLNADRSWSIGTVTSVGLSMPSAFAVASSPVTGAGTIAVTGAGVASQYIRGDGSLANFPTSTGGGASVSYYLNSSVSQGTIGGVAYKEINSVPVMGAGTDFTINADGYIAQFITDVGDPNKLLIPAGNWNFETYFSASSSGGSPRFYIELYKYNGTTFTLIASNSATPENITGGTAIDLYFTALAVPSTALLATDRLAVRFYVLHSGRTITMHTENSHLSQIITTFSTGLTALNGLSSQVQYLAVGTTGTDFNISSATDIHTFNLPTASATNRGALSSVDWTTFNNKVPTTRTLTINGTTQDLSADRTFTISTGITIGTTAITSGTNGRFLFDDAGVVSETNGAFWDKVNSRWGIGTITPQSKIDIRRTNATIQFDEFTTNSATGCLWFSSTKTTSTFSIAGEGTNTLINAPTGYVGFFQALAEKARFASGTGNFLINTNTDAGFKLDVNGTSRFQSTMIVNGNATINGTFTSTGSTGVSAIFTGGNAIVRDGNKLLVGGVSGNQTPDVSAVSEIRSTTKGFLPPRMTTTEKNAIATPATGLMVYDTTLNLISVYNGTTWITL